MECLNLRTFILARRWRFERMFLFFWVNVAMGLVKGGKISSLPARDPQQHARNTMADFNRSGHPIGPKQKQVIAPLPGIVAPQYVLDAKRAHPSRRSQPPSRHLSSQQRLEQPRQQRSRGNEDRRMDNVVDTVLAYRIGQITDSATAKRLNEGFQWSDQHRYI